MQAFFDAAVANGAEVLHEPRVWPEYHEHYFGAFVRDPDGNNVEAVCHTPRRLTPHLGKIRVNSSVWGRSESGPDSQLPQMRGGGRGRHSERHVAVLAAGQLLALGAQHGQAGDELLAGLRRGDHVVDVAALGGGIGIGVLLGVLGDQLGPAGGGSAACCSSRR